MKPTETWERIYKKETSVSFPLNTPEYLEVASKAPCRRDTEDSLEAEIIKETAYVPLGNPCMAFTNFGADIIINILDTFSDKGIIMRDYLKRVAIYTLNSDKPPEDLTELLSKKGFRKK